MGACLFPRSLALPLQPASPLTVLPTDASPLTVLPTDASPLTVLPTD